MRLNAYLNQINPILSAPETVRKLIRVFSAVLIAGILSGVYSFLLLTFDTEVSQRRSYMSSAIAEAHTFFTTREALLESLSLSATRKGNFDLYPSDEETHILLGNKPGQQWSIWLTQRMRALLIEKKLNLLYIGSGDRPQILRIYNTNQDYKTLPPEIVEQLQSVAFQNSARIRELWLTHATEDNPRLYIFIRLDERDKNSGWLGLEMSGHEVSIALNDHSAGEFTMFNSQGQPIFSNSPMTPPPILRGGQEQDCFGLVSSGWLPERIVLRKQLKSSNWQLTYSIELLAILKDLTHPIFGALLFSLVSISLICMVTRRLEQRAIKPAIQRIQALVESELFSSDVIQTAPVALSVLRRVDGKVVLENALARQWLCDRREKLGRFWIQAAFEKKDPVLTHYFEACGGRHLHLSCARTRYKGEDVLLCAFSDITTRRQIEASLEEARQSADAANEAKTLFLATMSHEIRTPLYGVLGTLELLTRTQLDSQQRGYLRAIESSSATLLQLICDVLDVSKIEAGQLALELSEFSPIAQAQEVIQGYAAAAHSKGLQLYTCIDPQIPERVIGDVSRLRQILNNLLNNAVKFTESGGVVLQVKQIKRDGERVHIEWQVTDTGKGIPTEDQKFIFDPFYQSKGSTNVVAGTGLGLPICQRLTHLMNGTLQMKSDPGLGTSFTLTVPLVDPSNASDRMTRPELAPENIYIYSPIKELSENFSGWLRRWGARPQTSIPEHARQDESAILLELYPTTYDGLRKESWKGPRVLASSECSSQAHESNCFWNVNLNDLETVKLAVWEAQGGKASQPLEKTDVESGQLLSLRILIAEDNVINQLILRDQLEELGCSVAVSSDGEEALSLWHKKEFDIVLTDVNMPLLNGYELAKALRSQGCTIPIIGATANAMRGEEALCFAAGMNHCLIKPFTLQALFTVLAPYQRVVHEE